MDMILIFKNLLLNKSFNNLADWLILTACQPINDYFFLEVKELPSFYIYIYIFLVVS